MEKHILESCRFYRFPLNRNVDQFIFIYFERIFFHPLCYLKRVLFRLENYPDFQDFFVAVRGIGPKTLGAKPSISQTFKIKFITKCLFRE